MILVNFRTNIYFKLFDLNFQSNCNKNNNTFKKINLKIRPIDVYQIYKFINLIWIVIHTSKIHFFNCDDGFLIMLIYIYIDKVTHLSEVLTYKYSNIHLLFVHSLLIYIEHNKTQDPEVQIKRIAHINCFRFLIFSSII